MKQIERFTSNSMLVILSLVFSVFIVYPDLMGMYMRQTREPEAFDLYAVLPFQVCKYILFCVLIFVLLKVNMGYMKAWTLAKRILLTLPILLLAYGVYLVIALLIYSISECFTGVVLFQFVVTWLMCALIGHIVGFYSERRHYEQEIEQLKLEKLQSRCDALTNQVNPHFFFNSLSGLSSLIRKDRKEQSLEYVDKLSAVFRYILQSDKKGVVTLREELGFLESFSYLMEVRFADKLTFDMHIDEAKLDLRLPVLSLLPLVDNVVTHNAIDSEEKMAITIRMNDRDELEISNPIHPKMEQPATNGTGLANLRNRFQLMMNCEIRVTNDGHTFRVFLPLNR